MNKLRAGAIFEIRTVETPFYWYSAAPEALRHVLGDFGEKRAPAPLPWTYSILYSNLTLLSREVGKHFETLNRLNCRGPLGSVHLLISSVNVSFWTPAELKSADVRSYFSYRNRLERLFGCECPQIQYTLDPAIEFGNISVEIKARKDLWEACWMLGAAVQSMADRLYWLSRIHAVRELVANHNYGGAMRIASEISDKLVKSIDTNPF